MDWFLYDRDLHDKRIKGKNFINLLYDLDDNTGLIFSGEKAYSVEWESVNMGVFKYVMRCAI